MENKASLFLEYVKALERLNQTMRKYITELENTIEELKKS